MLGGERDDLDSRWRVRSSGTWRRRPSPGRSRPRRSRSCPAGSSRGTAYFAPYPFFAEHGDGHYVYDVDGNRYLDFMLNATTLIVGHANPMVVEALGEQTRKGTAFSTPTEVQVRVARLLCDRIPSLDTIRFTNSGTEGTLMAIRAAWAFTGKPKLAKFEGGYHGAHEHVAVSVRPPASRLDPAGPDGDPRVPGPAGGRPPGRDRASRTTTSPTATASSAPTRTRSAR